MFDNHYFASVRKTFADQFTPDGDAFLYRKSLTSIPIRVSAAERDSFIAAFNRQMRYLFWGSVVTTMAGIALLVALTSDPEEISGLPFYLGLATWLVVYMVVFRRVWGTPARELARRAPAGKPLTRREARQLALSRMTYGQLGLAVLVAPVILWNVSDRYDVLHGWGRIWLAVAAVLPLAAAVQAVRKWRFERNPNGGDQAGW